MYHSGDNVFPLLTKKHLLWLAISNTNRACLSRTSFHNALMDWTKLVHVVALIRTASGVQKENIPNETAFMHRDSE